MDSRAPRLRAYLDAAATTPVRPAVARAMWEVLGADPADREAGAFANPSSRHAWGVLAAGRVAAARAEVARAVGADPREVVFTSGATEANHLAILGLCRARAREGRHVLTTAIEHSSVRAACAALRQEGFEVTEVPVDGLGRLDPGAVARAVRRDTVLVTFAHVNNEVGTVQPVAELVAAVRGASRAQGARVPAAVHVDGVQALGKVPTPYAAWGVDLATLSAHKLGGPKGIGALVVRGVRIAPAVPGGTQEGGLRPGTENVPGIVGFGAAVRLLREEPGLPERLRGLARALVHGLREALPGLTVNGPGPDHPDGAPHIVNVSFADVAPLPAEVLLHAFAEEGIACSAGSACESRRAEPSHVLVGLGLEGPRAAASLRFSVGPDTRQEEIAWAVARIPQALEAVRGAVRRP
jgi:cysteine desulfurase